MAKTMRVGTCIEFQIITDVEPDSCLITIIDPGNVYLITDAVMTKEATNVYTYLYQTSQASLDGEWRVNFKAIKGANTAMVTDYFLLENPDLGRLRTFV